MWYKKNQPRQTKGGIKAQTKRGTFGKNWWAKQWIEALESFHDEARLGRGRSYARKGQVVSIEINKGRIHAKVQGSRKKPYNVAIEVDMLSGPVWQEVVQILSNQAVFAAKLLANEMPHDIQTVFDDVGISLLPTSHDQLWTDCSCPDWSNPCKHVAAVYYLIGEEFDRDPFLIFRVRGIEREVFLHLLETSTNLLQLTPKKQKQGNDPLTADLSTFWKGEKLSEDFNVGHLVIPEEPGILLRSLGKFPFWRGKDSLENILQPFYLKSSKRILDEMIGEKSLE